MTEQFDPYRKWLGIPAQDQPPHHYRLLGIELFETDPDVICNAADARMAQIKTFQAGRHSAHSQRLLNEVAAAKVCLLNPAKKAEYDRQLREIIEDRTEERGERQGANAPGLRSGGGGEEEPDNIPPIVIGGTPSAYLARGRRKRQPAWLVPAVVFGVAVLAAVVLALALQEGGGETARKGRPPATPKTPPSAAKEKPSEPHPVKPVSPPPAPEQPAKEKPARPAQPPIEKERPEQPPIIIEPAEPKEEPAPPKQPDRKPPKGREKLPVPDAAAQRKMEMEIRTQFADDFAAADNARKKMALADKLRKQAGQVKGDPTARFVLFRLAAELIAGTGTLSRGFATIENLAKRYDANPLALKVDLAEAVAPKYRLGIKSDVTAADFWVNANTLLELADEAERTDDYTTAVRAAKLAVSLARTTKDADFIRETASELREIEHRKSRFRPVEAALTALAENPDDAEANLTVGRWRCYTLGDWDRGLPLLSKGSDAALADLARRDLASPKDAKDCLALAEAWNAAADKEQPQAKTGLLARAYHWFEQALPKLTGLEKAKLEKRLEEMREKNIRGSQTGGIVVKGNVALAGNGTTLGGIAEYPERLIDGKTSQNDGDKCSATLISNKPITIVFPEAYRLREIRLLLWNELPRSYNYTVSVSSDGESFTLVADCSKGTWTGWQKIAFPPRPVKAIRLLPIRKVYLPTMKSTERLTVVEVQAYCIPPKSNQQ